jgi:hypothetical protein
MTPLASMTAGLQAISSWMLSVLALLAMIVSVIIGILFVEFIMEPDAFARAYTVKTGLSDGGVSTPRNANEL